jgi:DNA-binding response OmpR family regulator
MRGSSRGIEPTYTVLAVDDDESIRSLLVHYLEEQVEGFVVETASNGRAALETLRGDAVEVDAVLLDISMPEMDGFETLDRIQEEGHDLVVIVLSGRDGEEEQLQAFDLGALDFVKKPFSPEVLTARLKLNLAREAELRQSWPEGSDVPTEVGE